MYNSELSQYSDKTSERERTLNTLRNIFRLIAQSVTPETAKDKLSPGEIGIDYDNLTIYSKHPITNEIVTPNSLAYLKKILEKFDPESGILQADKVKNMTFYQSIYDVGYISGYTLTVDTIVRQMKYPSIMNCIVEAENKKLMGIPSDKGILYICKLSESDVFAYFNDSATSTFYTGKYDRNLHLFLGWKNNDSVSENTESIGDESVEVIDGVLVKITLQTEYIDDMHSVRFRTPLPIYPGAVATFNGGPTFPIVMLDGSPLAKQIDENNIIILIYDDIGKRCLYTGIDTSIAESLLLILKSRIDTNSSKIENISNSISAIYNKISAIEAAIAEINDINSAIDEINTSLSEVRMFISTIDEWKDRIERFEEEVSQQFIDITNTISSLTRNSLPFDIKTEIYSVESYSDGEIIPLSRFNPNTDFLTVNYMQAVLRDGIDYIRVENGIRLLKISPRTGTKIVFTIFYPKMLSDDNS